MQVKHNFFQQDNYTPITRVTSPRITKLQNNWSCDGPSTAVVTTRGVTKPRISELRSTWSGPSSSGVVKKHISIEKENVSMGRSQPMHGIQKTQNYMMNFRRKHRENTSAIIIQKIIRGWLQRLQFRILSLKHQLDIEKKRTKESIISIQERLQRQKATFMNDMQKQINESQALEEAVKENSAVIARIRNENKQLRESNTKLAKEIQSLQIQNKRLEDEAAHTCECLRDLGSQMNKMNDSYEKLVTVTGKFQSSIEAVEKSLERHQECYMSEYTIRMMYYKAIGKITENMESQCVQHNLVNKVVASCLALEKMENSLKSPTKL